MAQLHVWQPYSSAKNSTCKRYDRCSKKCLMVAQLKSLFLFYFFVVFFYYFIYYLRSLVSDILFLQKSQTAFTNHILAYENPYLHVKFYKNKWSKLATFYLRRACWNTDKFANSELAVYHRSRDSIGSVAAVYWTVKDWSSWF